MRGILTISLRAIRENYKFLQQKTSGVECAAVVKADAYGLGLAPVAKTLWQAGARKFFVAMTEEALALRAVLPEATIYILKGLLPGEENDLLQHNLIPVINDDTQTQLWQQTATNQGRLLPAILHVDTGLNRMGFNANDFSVANFDGFDVHYIMSHLACADEPAHPLNDRQRQRLTTAGKYLPHMPLSLAASDGIFCGPDFYFDLVRPGAALYGLNPTPQQKNPMQDVIQLSVPILQTRVVEQDGTVGYSATQTVKKAQRLATVALGYADGLPRSLSNTGHLFYDGHALPILGRVSMDFITVDLSALPNQDIRPGDRLEVFGRAQSPEQLAQEAGTIDYEIMTRLGQRFERVYSP